MRTYMSRRKYPFIDIVVMAFIFMNVLPVTLPSGLAVRYILLLILAVASFFLFPQYFTTISSKSYSLRVCLIFFILTIYSLLYGNKTENIMIFVNPLTVLLSIPALKYCIQVYGIKRYLYCFSVACVLLIGIFLYIHVNSMNYGLLFMGHLSDTLSFIRAGESDYGGRIVISTFVFVIPFSIIWMNKLKGIPLYAFSLFMFVIAALSQTMGIFLPVVGYFFYLLFKRKEWKNLIIIFVVVAYVYGLYKGFVGDFIEIKSGSAEAKTTQMDELFKDFHGIDYLFGRGIGCMFKNFGGRDINDPMIEVAFVQIVQMGGLIFMWLLLYVYLGPPIKMLKYKNDIYAHILAFSQFGFFIASLSNPYLWSAGGLFFNLLIVAYEHNMKYNCNVEQVIGSRANGALTNSSSTIFT